MSTLGETHVSSSRLESSRLGLTQFQIVMDGEISMAEVEQYAEEIVGSLPPRILGAVLASPADDEATLIGGDQ